MRLRLLLIPVLVLTCAKASAGIPVPVSGHPKLFVTADDIPTLRAKMQTERGQSVLSRMDSLSVPRSADEEAAVALRDFRYYFQMRGLGSKAPLLALDCLVNGNAEAGREAVSTVLDSLKKTSFGKEYDLSRANGVMLLTGAMVYDWCYQYMTCLQKQEYIREFKRIASAMECGYPITFSEAVTGHTCEWMIMRDMLSAGVAIYDECPEMYNEAMRIICGKFLPVRNYCYEGGNFHQGTKYLPTRYSSELFAQWIIKKATGSELFSAAQRDVIYDSIYRMRPDGTLLPYGDENPIRRQREENLALPAMLAASYYGDAHINWLYGRNPEVIAHSLIFDLLLGDYELGEESPENLPLSRYSGTPFGWTVARTGWGPESVIADLRINEKFAGNHQHLDGGAFQIWYKGSLAVDSGIYEGTERGYWNKHNLNYAKRTVAHNCLLVYDPEEEFIWAKARNGKPDRVAANDGGQRFQGKRGWDPPASLEQMARTDDYNVGKVLSHYESDSLTYLRGDITAAYSDKVKRVEREFVFCNTGNARIPAALVVFDRVEAVDASFKKSFLLHSIEEPQISGNVFTVRRNAGAENGMLHVTALLPEKVNIEKTGGDGHEFESGGVNWSNSLDDSTLECGAWRTVENAPAGQLKDVFFNVILVSDTDSFKPVKVRRMDGDGIVGADFCGYSIWFAEGGMLSGKKVSVKVPGRRNLVVCDLEAGNYEVKRNGRTVCTVCANGNIICIPSAKRGKYELNPIL